MPQPLRGRRSASVRILSKRYERTSARSRGYSARWDRLSAEYRRRHPFCAWCEQRGRLAFAKLVDHKIPITDGGAIFDPSNWQGLCVPCHGIKTSMDAYARRFGETECLPLWCDDPEARPRQFR